MTEDEARQRLESELRDVEAMRADTAGDRQPVELDQQSVGRLSRMDALQVQAMAQATEERRRQRAGKVRAALRRLDEGLWGECVGCGEEIAPARLALDPAAATCIACASGGDR